MERGPPITITQPGAVVIVYLTRSQRAQNPAAKKPRVPNEIEDQVERLIHAAMGYCLIRVRGER